MRPPNFRVEAGPRTKPSPGCAGLPRISAASRTALARARRGQVARLGRGHQRLAVPGDEAGAEQLAPVRVELAR